jgi:hypothetical protein
VPQMFRVYFLHYILKVNAIPRCFTSSDVSMFIPLNVYVCCCCYGFCRKCQSGDPASNPSQVFSARSLSNSSLSRLSMPVFDRCSDGSERSAPIRERRASGRGASLSACSQSIRAARHWRPAPMTRGRWPTRPLAAAPCDVY